MDWDFVFDGIKEFGRDCDFRDFTMSGEGKTRTVTYGCEGDVCELILEDLGNGLVSVNGTGRVDTKRPNAGDVGEAIFQMDT